MRTRRLAASLISLVMGIAGCAPAGPSPTPSTASPSPSAPAPAASTSPTPGPSAAPAAAFRDWTRIDLPDPAPGIYGGASPTGVVAFHGGYIAIGSIWAACCAAGDPSLSRGVVWTSADGRSWSMRDRIPAFEHASLTGLVMDGSRLVAVGSYAAPIPNEPGVSVPAVWVSSDGTAWVRASEPVPSFVTVGPHGLIGAVTTEGPSGSPNSVRFVTSRDGLAWTSASGSFEALLRGLAAAADGTAVAVGEVPEASRAERTTTIDMVVWHSANGTTWTGPETIGYEARPVAVTGDAGGFLAVVWLTALLASGSIGTVSQVWRLVDGGGPHVTPIVLGDAESLARVFALGDTLLATGDTLVNGNANAMIWVSTDGGATWGRVADQPAFSDINNELTGMVQTPGGLLAVGRRWDTSAGHPVPEAWVSAP
jgi:hypothetical protein